MDFFFFFFDKEVAQEVFPAHGILGIKPQPQVTMDVAISTISGSKLQQLNYHRERWYYPAQAYWSLNVE